MPDGADNTGSSRRDELTFSFPESTPRKNAQRAAEWTTAPNSLAKLLELVEPQVHSLCENVVAVEGDSEEEEEKTQRSILKLDRIQHGDDV